MKGTNNDIITHSKGTITNDFFTYKPAIILVMRYLHIGHDALIVLDGALPLESLHLLVANLQTGKLNVNPKLQTVVINVLPCLCRRPPGRGRRWAGRPQGRGPSPCTWRSDTDGRSGNPWTGYSRGPRAAPCTDTSAWRRGRTGAFWGRLGTWSRSGWSRSLRIDLQF